MEPSNLNVEALSATFERLCGTFLWSLGTFKCGTCMLNLSKPGARLLAGCLKHPEALLASPQAFQAVGEQKSHFSDVFTSIQQDLQLDHNILTCDHNFSRTAVFF